MKPKNTICLWFDKNALEAARFYAATFPDSKVNAVLQSPGDYPDGKAGDVLVVEFTFTEPDGTFRRGSTNVKTDWPGPRTGTVPVEYTPGELGRARLAGHVSWVGIIIFATALIVVGVFGYMMWKEANEEYRSKRRK